MRRQFVTHPRFQAQFTFSFVLGIILIFLILGGSTVLTMFLLSNDPLINESQKLILRDHALGFSKYLGFLMFLSVIVLGWMGFYLSYKFVGPLYRLESWLSDRFEKKDSGPINLRPGDEMEPISIALNRIILKKFGKKGP